MHFASFHLPAKFYKYCSKDILFSFIFHPNPVFEFTISTSKDGQCSSKENSILQKNTTITKKREKCLAQIEATTKTIRFNKDII